MNFFETLQHNLSRGPHYEEDKPGKAVQGKPPVRLIAFYLPQFHPIPENDTWWGKGFTEWTNVTKAVPRFAGHYQPHLPDGLGFYDLRMPEALQQQADLAKRYGIHGFCFHHYWFAGKTLLETPIQNLLNYPEIDLPFCINWANENWSRRWDGLENDVLMKQEHSPKDDIAFATSLEPFIRDPRYIKIDGKPLLMLYRPDLLPDAKATVTRWRKHFGKLGINLYITHVQGFDNLDPRKYGMDAAVGMPPHNAGWDRPRLNKSRFNWRLKLFDKNYKGDVIRYSDMAEHAARNNPTEFTLFPGICPSWDNEARKPNRSFCFTEATPVAYAQWLKTLCKQVIAKYKGDERTVFINAWNEWAEGAHLEPDRHFGYAYLAATANVLNGLKD